MRTPKMSPLCISLLIMLFFLSFYCLPPNLSIGESLLDLPMAKAFLKARSMSATYLVTSNIQARSSDNIITRRRALVHFIEETLKRISMPPKGLTT